MRYRRAAQAVLAAFILGSIWGMIIDFVLDLEDWGMRAEIAGAVIIGTGIGLFLWPWVKVRR
ncbi:hypothetical protein LCGC14_2650850 [marine sediment metagenome]|uniref:Uncharacterized protein n=1 Tax=marine sediment metagenome TaxID=412755 RepID=A0A0F8ZUT3_9ZZZZ